MKTTNRSFKQVMAFLLSCLLLLQLVPLSVFAADKTSGSCGESLTWRIDEETETLYIEGEGAMYDYGDVYDDEGNWVEYIPTPWYGQNLYHVVLDDRITYIGTDAFNGNQYESIELPSKLKSIGNYAFAYSDKLTVVSLPEGLETMGTGVFISCASLETVSIPSTLTVIPYNTFWQCQKLANVTIAEGVEEIGEGVFSSCGINRIEIPGSVKQIGSYAFERNSKLTELVLNDGLEQIGDGVFQGCNSLREVTIPSTVQAVGDYAFMPGPGDMWIGENSFMEKNPQGVMNLYVLSKDLSLYSTNMWGETTDLWTMYSTTIHAYADSRMAQEIEAYNAEISEDMAENRITFYPLTEGEHSFSDWAKVDEKTHSRSCGDCDAEEVRPHTMVIDMDNYTLRSCEEDERYRWVCTACDYVGEFYTDPSWVATGHSLSDSYTQYEDYHAAYCYNCSEEVQSPHEWSYTPDPDATGSYVVDAVCSVCQYEKAITVGNSGTCGPNLTWRLDGDTLYIEGYGPMDDYGVVYDEEGNWVVDDEGNTVENPTPWYKGDYTRIELDDRITHIGKAAFGREYIDNYYSGFSLESIELPSKLESIGDYAFCTISGVEEIVLPEGLKEMGVGVFANCEDLKSVTIPSTLKVIPEQAFEMCFRLENVTIAEGVEEIGVAAFMQCNDAWNSSNYENYAAIPGIKRIEIPGSVKKIGDSAFFGDVTLTELVLNEGLEEIGAQVFDGCSYLRSVTIPSTVKTIGRDALCSWGADMYLGNNSFMDKDPKGPMNLYVLSKDVSLYATVEWELEEGEQYFWFHDYATIHAYADSKIAEEIEAYNAEITEDVTFYPITDDDHSFSDWTSQDLYYHSRTCADCGLEEKRYHTLVIDMYNYTIKTCEKSESYRWICTECDFVSEFFTDPEWASNGHALYTGEYGQHPDYHTTWCTNCYEDLKFPHEWAYAHDPNATEPYEVDAVCSVCGYTDTITVIPDGMAVISAKARDENGNDVTLPEDAYTVVWQDGEGNRLGEGTQYTHTQDWEVTFSNPVIAVLTFSKEIRQAYSVGEKIEHTVTKLGENTEYVLTPRDTLTVTGKVSPLVGGTKVTLTTVLAGNESVIDLELDDEGVFTTQIRRTAATLTVSSQGYETVQLENVQMIASDENGVIDLGTLSLGDRYATEYLSVEFTDAESMAIARYLVEKNVSVVLTAEDGTEYHGAGIRKVPGESDTADSYKFRILLGRDVSDYFALGQQVTLSYLDPAGYVIAPCTVIIARDGEQQALPLVLEKAPELSIKLSEQANLYVFDEAGKSVYSGFTKNAKLLLEKGKYTVVAFEYNNVISTIDSPDMLELGGISDDLYIRETIDLTGDTEKSYTIPRFNLRSEVGFSVTVGQNLRVGDLVPIQITYSDKYDEGAAEIAGLELYISGGKVGDFVLVQVNGQYAFGTADMRLSEEMHFAGSSQYLLVTTHQPAGTITVYAKATGRMVFISAKNGMGQTTITLPGNDVEWTVPDTLAEAEGTLPLRAVLPQENAPYTANLYINGSLQSQMTLQTKGLGENEIPYALEKLDDSVSTHILQLEVLDKNGESVWISPAHMVMLTDAVDHPRPKILNVRAAFEGDSGNSAEKRFDLQGDDNWMSFYVASTDINEDNTFNSNLVFDYRLTMSNYTQVKNDVVYLRVFCGKNNLEPTVTLVPLRLNPETYTFDGTFVMEANTCTVVDLPYGYSFEYATISPLKASINQAIGSVGGYMEELRNSYSENTFVYVDPDELEFNLDNCDALTEEDKEVLRTLQAIENSMYTLRLQNEGRIQSAIAESYGPGAVDPTLSDAQKLAAVYEAAGGTVESVEGVSEADLLDMGYTAQTVEDNTVYMYTDEETGYVSVVDPVNGLHFYSGTPAVATFSGEALSGAQIEWLFLSILNSTKTLFDQVIDNLSGIRNYYNNTLATLLGCQGNVDSIKKQIAYYKDYVDGLAKDIDSMPSIQRQTIEQAHQTALRIDELMAAEKHIADMQKKLKWAQGELSVAARCVSDQQARHRVVTKLNSVMNGWEAISNNPVFKGAFMVLDVRTVVLNVIDACSLYDVYESRAERIESTMDRADKAYRAMYRESLSECLANPEAAQEALKECSEIYDEFIVTCLEAQDWNRNWAVTHLVRMVTDDASIAMGYLAKSPQGMIASMAVGLVGLTSECIGVNMFNSYLDDINELYPDLNSACLDPLPFAKKDDCEEEDPNEDPDGSGDEDEEEDDSNVGLGAGGLSDQAEQPQYPIRTNPQIDPAGYVYEAVASNRIEGATAKVYYEGENGEEIYWSDADLYGEINPQITNADGRFAWMTPIGNWRVKITKDGYLDADSKYDPAAVDGWLPVPPPQLDVNIGLISTAAPTVASVDVAADQIRVVFSQYMDIAQVSGLVTVTQNGQIIPVAVTFEDAEVSPTNAAVYYGRVMKLTRTDGQPFSGDGIEVHVSGEAKNYAGTALGDDYASGMLAPDQILGSLSHSYPNRYVTDVARTEEIVVQVLDTNGKPMAGVSVTAKQKVGGTLQITESAVSDENGRAVFTVKGIASGYDVVIFEAGVVRMEMNTRVSSLATTAPKKPTANLNDYVEVEKGTQLILTYPGTDDVVIYYTTNNTCPCTDSADRKIYDGPITITEDTFFRIAAWTQAGGYSERLNLHITVKADEHVCKDHLTHVEAVEATCFENGNVEYWYCADCGYAWLDAECTVSIDLSAVVLPMVDHTYANAFDAHCDACGAVREAVNLIIFGGNSVSEDVRGLAFCFLVNGDHTNLQWKNDSDLYIDYDNCIVTSADGDDYKLVSMGAVVTNNGGDTYLDNVNGRNVINVVAEKVIKEGEDAPFFAIRVVNIPEAHFDTAITARSYFVYENGAGEQFTVYGAEQMATYNSVLNG